MNDDVPKESSCIFRDVLESSITYEWSKDYLSEARKEKRIQCSNRRKASLYETIGSSSIQYHKNCYVIYTTHDHINRYLKRKYAEQPVTSQVRRIRRSSTRIFDFKKRCIICGENCNVIKDKKHLDRWKKNKDFCCRTADLGKRNLFFK